MARLLVGVNFHTEFIRKRWKAFELPSSKRFQVSQAWKIGIFGNYSDSAYPRTRTGTSHERPPNPISVAAILSGGIVST